MTIRACPEERHKSGRHLHPCSRRLPKRSFRKPIAVQSVCISRVAHRCSERSKLLITGACKRKLVAAYWKL